MVITIHKHLMRNTKKVMTMIHEMKVMTMTLFQNLPFFMSCRILAVWNKSKKLVISDFSTTGWLLSVDQNERKYAQ